MFCAGTDMAATSGPPTERGGVYGVVGRRRVVVHDWSMSTRLDADAFPLPMDSFVQGRRDRSDLIYET